MHPVERNHSRITDSSFLRAFPIGAHVGVFPLVLAALYRDSSILQTDPLLSIRGNIPRYIRFSGQGFRRLRVYMAFGFLSVNKGFRSFGLRWVRGDSTEGSCVLTSKPLTLNPRR